MNNDVLLFVSIAIIFSILLLTKKLFGLKGLTVWIAVATILAEIATLKGVIQFGMYATLGNVLFASNFLATDIITEAYGEKEARKSLFIGVWSVIVFFIITQLMLAYTPSDIDFAHQPMTDLFTVVPRICIASIAMLFIANYLDIKLYAWLKKKTNGKHMWLRNNVSTIACNCLENFAFFTVAYIGIYQMQEIMSFAIITSIIEVIVGLCDTPFLYIATKIKEISFGKRGKSEVTC